MDGNYRILTRRTIDELEEIVTEYVNMGYTPTGGVFVERPNKYTGTLYYQSIYLPKKQ